MNHEQVTHAIAKADGSFETAEGILQLLKARTGTTKTLVYDDVLEMFAGAVIGILRDNDPREKLALLDLVDGKPDAAAVRYEKLVAAGGERSRPCLQRLSGLLTPTHPALAREACVRLLAANGRDADARVRYGFVLLGSGELKPAGEAFVAVLEGLSMSYRRVRITSAARAFVAGAPDMTEALLVRNAFNGLWRVRLAQQFPHWAGTVHQSAVLMHGGLAREYPKLARRSDAAGLQLWDLAAAAVLTYELIMSAHAAMSPHFNMKLITDAALCPAPMPFSPQGPRQSAAYDDTQTREDAFKTHWNKVRNGLVSKCTNTIWDLCDRKDWLARLNSAKTIDERVKLTKQFAEIENVAVASWLLTTASGEAPTDSAEVLASLGRMCQKITQGYAYRN